MSGIRYIAVAVFLILAGITDGARPELVQAAFATMDAADIDAWAYTVTTIENGVERVATHDPTRSEAERWTLVSIDGRPPTEKERARYRPRAQGGSDEGFGAMVRQGSLELIEETPARAVYTFELARDDDEERGFNEHLDARLTIVKSGPYVERLEMRSRGPFSPAFLFKVREFALVMSFEPLEGDGAVLPASVSTRIAGRAMLLKKIDERVDVVFSDFRRPVHGN